MTLHEAIELVLIKNGGSLSSREIAEKINQRKLYARADGSQVPASQISARVRNYPKLFTSLNGKIKLVKDDPASLMFHQY